MSGVLQYEALNERGHELLDALEEHWGARRVDETTREFYVPAAGTVDLDPNLAALDPNWAEHIQRITER